MRRATAFLAILTLGEFVAACGSRVSGHTFHNNGGVVQIEFKAGGKALVSNGACMYTCRYAETGRSLDLTCDDGTTDFTMQDDGALVGPSTGAMARLTPVKN
jgi:hypothetical protein